MKMWKRYFIIFVAWILFMSNTGELGLFDAREVAQAAESNKTKTMSVDVFLRKVERAVGLEKGFLAKENMGLNGKEPITWCQAVVFLNQADEWKNGDDYDEKLYKQIVEKKRLTGLKGLSKEEKAAARICFAKGLITGDSKGKYSQSREFRGNDKVTVSEVHKMLVRLKDATRRAKLSPDGQLLRTTKLPDNYEKYEYILASFPNEFYERKLFYEMITYHYEPVNLVNYASPKDIKKKKTISPYVESGTFEEMYYRYGEKWIETIHNNLECRFNFDYRTVDSKWINKLAATYIYDEDAEYNKRVVDAIKAYIQMAKENKVVIEADKIVVEPSTMYYAAAEYFVRCHVKFKITADEIYPAKEGQLNRQHELLFSRQECVCLENLKDGKWYEMSIDVPIRQTAGNQNPATYTIGSDQIWSWK